MLRSFNYAHWSALRRVAQNPDELERLQPSARAWEQQARDAFLAGYRQGLETSASATEAQRAAGLDARRGLLALFELERAFYELRYEIGNRPDWVGVPLQGIAGLLG
jgi:maltose alpha-D-glucosyltransferase/alpha-amylase